MPTVYSGNCETNNATLTSSTNVDGQASPLYYLNDEIKPVLELTVPSTVRLGSRFTVNVRLSEDSKDFFFILLNYVKIIYGADSTYVVEDGCDDEDFVAFFSYDGDIFSGPVASTYTTVELDLFIPGTRIDSDTIILTIEVQAKICPSEYASACAPVECSKRRRRQIDEQQTASAKTSVVVFLEEESRQKFQENMRKELGLVDAASTKSEEDLCVNKTTSAVVLVILIAGMVLCLMATCWMFIKMRKSRRSESSGKSEFAFSNKSVKY